MKTILLPLGTERIAVADALYMMVEKWPDDTGFDIFIDGNGIIQQPRYRRDISWNSEQRQAIEAANTPDIKQLHKENLLKGFITFCHDKTITPTSPMTPWSNDYTGEVWQNGLYEISADEFKMFAKPYGFEVETEAAPAAKVEAGTDTSRSGDDVNDYDSGNWIIKCPAIAQKLGEQELKDKGIRQINASSISESVAEELALDQTTHGRQGPRSSHNVRTEGLKGWKV